MSPDEVRQVLNYVMRQGPAGVRSPLDLLNDLSADDVRAALDTTAGRPTANTTSPV
jgi:hypothetical protein